jgi:predicted negative regulator of RcsB-dependent stress response
MFELVVGVLLGFAGGYGVREIISRQRRKRAQASHFAQLVLRSRRKELSQREQIEKLKDLANIAVGEPKR